MNVPITNMSSIDIAKLLKAQSGQGWGLDFAENLSDE